MTSPIAIVDIGSNSVRLVAYEALSRAPMPIFNEKSLCALGHGVVTTRRLPQDGIDKAIAALRRFRVVCDMLGAAKPLVIATAAARDATNGAEFLAAATAAIQAPVTLLSGPREAELSALGVISGIYKPDGVVGDLGGGSLELIDVKGMHPGKGTSLPLGGLALMDASDRSPRAASKIVREALAKSRVLEKLAGRTFYAVGGTWRALARLHMRQRNYPVHVMHGYGIAARDAADFAGLVERVDVETLLSIDAVNAARRPLLAYGAIVLEEVIRAGQPKDITISTAGVREGLLFEQLDAVSRRADPLLASAGDYNRLLSRAPRHAEELCAWTDAFMQSTHLEETADERRLRHAACLLSDVNWRAHPDYRSVQGLNLVANANFSGIDHPGRAFLALATAYRHLGPFEDPDFQIRALASPRSLDRARILGAAMRVAYLISAAQPGVLPRTPMLCAKSKVRLELPPELTDLGSDRIFNRVRQLARLIGREAELAA
jgi:exopolyphosphatase/guanosine-5'-triphosphate,3'-diphosphate pyrophosphatase